MVIGISIAVGGAADKELAALASEVEVYERMGETTTCRLRFPVAISEGDLPLLTDARLSAGSELTITAEADGSSECLMKGPVYGQQIHLVHGGEGSYVDVLAADTSIAMDRENKAALWPEVTDSDAISAILGQYGYTPDVESTSAGHPEAKHTLVQRETDLRFVRRLARRNGQIFWIEADAMGMETAHCRRPPLSGPSGPELIIILDTPNIDQLDITWDTERPTSAAAFELDLNTKSDLDGSARQTPQSPLGAQGLNAIATGKRELYMAAPADDAGDLRARSEAALIEADFFVRANCRTSVNALKKIVRAHKLVKLSGAGSRHSGDWFCAGVRHLADETGHRMEIELVRNAWGA